MKEKMKKFSTVCKMIFGYGIMLVLFGGGITFFGYLAALVIGGETAAAICTFIYRKYIPILIYASTILVLFGLFSMYIAGELALMPTKKKAKNKKEKS